MLQKFNSFMESKNWIYVAFFAIGFGASLFAFYPFPALLIVTIWGAIVLMERGRI